ncbi:hypothetical protein [Fervidibacter sp.]|jgi:hypothetical protein
MLKLMRLIASVLIGISVATFVFNEVKVSAAQTAKSDKSTVSFAADKGPSKIDPKVLATYSPKAKAIYSLFRNKCSKCHTLARPLNTDLPPTKWEEYIKRMMSKPGSGIKPSEAKEIWQFLVYDTAKRKTKFFNTLPEKEKQIAQKVVATLEGNASSN